MSSVLSSPLAVPAERPRLMAALLGTQICGSTGHSVSPAIGSIVAVEITGTNTWCGLPVATGALGAGLASLPLARLMGRFGRRRAWSSDTAWPCWGAGSPSP